MSGCRNAGIGGRKHSGEISRETALNQPSRVEDRLRFQTSSAYANTAV